MNSLSEVLTDLRRPFTAAAVRWKIQTNPKTPTSSALIVAFIDSRLVAERLNTVVGGDWSDTYAPLAGTSVVCRLTVLGATREDVGWTADVSSDKGVKTVYSDAFKRAGVKFGIGSSLYALPQIWLRADQLKQRGTSWAISPEADRQLRDRYATWVARPEVEKRFGKPIDHGDTNEVMG